MTATLISTLPGNIPGLLRRGSPALLLADYLDETERRATVHAVRADGTIDIAWARNRGRDGYPLYDPTTATQVSPDRVALDLTDPTGRAHAAWWTFQQRDPQEGWTGFPPPISVEESMVRRCAIMGADMTPEQIDALARLVLRLAGRE